MSLTAKQDDVKKIVHKNLLSLSTNWQWLSKILDDYYNVSAIEEEMLDLTSESFSNYKSIYTLIIRILSIEKADIVFCNKHLKSLKSLALCFKNKINIRDINFKGTCNSFKVLYLGLIFAKTYKNECIFDLNLLLYNNLFTILDIDLLNPYYSLISKVLNGITFKNFDIYKQIFFDNYKKVNKPFDLSILKQYMANLTSDNIFNYELVKLPNFVPWEYPTLLSMISIKIGENKQMHPFSTFSGVSYPDMSYWTADVIAHLKDYFKDFDTGLLIIETIGYIKLNIRPSNKLIIFLFEKVYRNLRLANKGKNGGERTPFLRILSELNKDHFIDKTLRRKYFKKLFNEQNKITDYDRLLLYKEHNLLVGGKGNAETLIFKKYNEIIKKTNLLSVSSKLDNPLFYKYITAYRINSLYYSLYKVWLTSDNSVKIAYTYYDFKNLLIHLIKALMNNEKDIKLNVDYLSKMLIKMYKLWRNKLFKRASSMLDYFSSTYKISDETIDGYFDNLINDQIGIASYLMRLYENQLLEDYKKDSLLEFNYFTNFILIGENGPYKSGKDFIEKDSISNLLEYQNKIMEKNKIKAPDYVKSDNYYFNQMFFKSIDENIEKYLAIIRIPKNVGKLVAFIKPLLKKYNLTLCDNLNEITLGHVTQLIPVLEQEIRNYGIKLGVVPFNLKDGFYDQFREPSSIILKIVNEEYGSLKNFDNVPDLLFILYTMYYGNGLNIRNKLIHAQSDITNEFVLQKDYVCILICLKFILFRNLRKIK